jgi:hypothetical protein
VISSTIGENPLMVMDSASLDLTLQASVLSGKVNLAPLFRIADTTELDLTLSGAGTESSPFTLSGSVRNVDTESGTPGQVLTKQADGTWRAAAAVSAPIGAVSTRVPVAGDGSSQSPIRLLRMTYAELEALPTS